MTLQNKLKRIGDALAAEIPHTYHYYRPQMELPYCVWTEDGEEGSLATDNRKAEQLVKGVVDYYTRTEYDPALDTIQDIFESLKEHLAFGWVLEAVAYEEETNIVHYTWRWGVA